MNSAQVKSLDWCSMVLPRCTVAICSMKVESEVCLFVILPDMETQKKLRLLAFFFCTNISFAFIFSNKYCHSMPC